MGSEIIQTVGMLVFKDNFTQVLLTKHTSAAKHLTGKYGVPAGRLKPGETEIQALLRKLAEETGLTAGEKDVVSLPFEYTAVIERKDEPPRQFNLKVWYCKNYSGEPKESEQNIPKWVEVEQLSSFDLLPNMERVVKDAVGYLKNV
jgi:mutator protein MutT